MSVDQVAALSKNNKTYNSWINNLLKQDGINPADKPFKSYLFIIMVVMEGIETQKKESNIDKFASALKAVSRNTTAWENFKNAFYAIGTSSNSGVKENTQAAYNVESTFFNASAGMLNSIFGNYMATHGYSPFEANGDSLNVHTIDSIFSNIAELSPADINKYFPAIGSNIKNIITNINSLRKLFESDYHNGNAYANPFDTWKDALNAGTNGLPKPTMLQAYMDSFSEGASTISGVGGPESSKLQMAQQDFNRLQSFIKSMLTDWVAQKKSFNSSMAQANS
ncbi:MAG: hypothetical protein P0S95_02115 [Rhabdochlamydiaceae bacterium]|nr:hypothetical protein [Candidatus Amphrikana amoebophyrae]